MIDSVFVKSSIKIGLGRYLFERDFYGYTWDTILWSFVANILRSMQSIYDNKVPERRKPLYSYYVKIQYNDF